MLWIVAAHGLQKGRLGVERELGFAGSIDGLLAPNADGSRTVRLRFQKVATFAPFLTSADIQRMPPSIAAAAEFAHQHLAPGRVLSFLQMKDERWALIEADQKGAKLISDIDAALSVLLSASGGEYTTGNPATAGGAIGVEPSPPPPEKPKSKGGCFLRWAAGAAIAFLVIFWAVHISNRDYASSPTSDETSEFKSDGKSVEKYPSTLSEKEKYILVLRKEIAAFEKPLDVSLFTATKDTLLVAAAVTCVYGQIYEQGARYELSSEETKLRRRFKEKAIARQVRVLPIYRDKYGPLAAKAGWIHDLDVRTYGPGYRTIEFTGGMLAANRNVQEAMDAIAETLNVLRYKQAIYHWAPHASGTLYALHPPPDNVLAVLENGTLRAVAE